MTESQAHMNVLLFMSQSAKEAQFLPQHECKFGVGEYLSQFRDS